MPVLQKGNTMDEETKAKLELREYCLKLAADTLAEFLWKNGIHDKIGIVIFGMEGATSGTIRSSHITNAKIEDFALVMKRLSKKLLKKRLPDRGPINRN
jgi:hypothetical protein